MSNKHITKYQYLIMKKIKKSTEESCNITEVFEVFTNINKEQEAVLLLAQTFGTNEDIDKAGILLREMN